MIIEQDNHPCESLYFRAYEILLYIKTYKKPVYELEDLFSEYNRITKLKTEFPRFLLLVDWLYMNDCVSITNEGNVIFHVFN